MNFSSQLEDFLSRNKFKKIVFTNGCFDILHRGHLEYLSEAKRLGDLLILGLNSDQSVKKLKGEFRPINNELDRKFFLENLRSVDFVEIFSEEDPLKLIMKIKPSILVKGGDWAVEKIVGSEFVLKNGGQVKSLKFLDGHSTTNLISYLQGRT